MRRKGSETIELSMGILLVIMFGFALYGAYCLFLKKDELPPPPPAPRYYFNKPVTEALNKEINGITWNKNINTVKNLKLKFCGEKSTTTQPTFYECLSPSPFIIKDFLVATDVSIWTYKNRILGIQLTVNDGAKNARTIQTLEMTLGKPKYEYLTIRKVWTAYDLYIKSIRRANDMLIYIYYAPLLNELNEVRKTKNLNEWP